MQDTNIWLTVLPIIEFFFEDFNLIFLFSLFLISPNFQYEVLLKGHKLHR